jgi:putative aldouronate transport system permease protein
MKIKLSDRIFDISLIAVSLVIIIVVSYPLYFIIIASISDAIKVLNGDVLAIPKGINFNAYTTVFGNESVWNGYRNSLLYTSIGTFVNVILTMLAAYPLSRKDLPGRNIIMMAILFTMYFNGGLIPTYLLVRTLGLYNTMWALILPGAVSTYNLIVMRTYFQTNIPNELLESAYIDGYSEFRTFLNIVLPLSGPIIAVIALFYAVGHWNAFFNALIYLRNSKLYPLQLILREILLQSQAENYGIDDMDHLTRVRLVESMKYALIIVASLPVLLIYPFVQRFFVKGIMVGAIKG